MENITHIKPEENVSSAEESVRSSIERFESAMDQLAQKLEQSNQSFGRIKDALRRPIEMATEIKQTLTREFENYRPYVQKIQSYSGRVADQVRSNPRPYVIAIVGLVGIAVVAGLFSQREKTKQIAA